VREMSEDMKKAALEYHAKPRPGKISVTVTKPAATSRDLSLAYSPGVAEPVREIAREPELAYRYTAKGNLVAVISDGTAILGLGDLGALASKPVMEGKGLLFKLFAGIDVFDIEVESETPQDFIDTVMGIHKTFGGINLEDIKAPECFEIERVLKEQCDIPVFHDDQHGTAIVVGAGVLNALELQKKKIEDIKVVCVGAGAAGVASIRLLIEMGAKKENILTLDRKGVIHSRRDDLSQFKAALAVDTSKRTLNDAIEDADVFIGVSGPDMLTQEMVKLMAPKPIIFALANPDPEIRPELAREARADAIIATGRSDYPNQVNNVLGFPYIFRGALDVRSTSINEAMKLAAVRAIASLVHEPVPEEVIAAYGGEPLSFGPEYIIPKPNDPRLLGVVSAAVAKAAVATGVARKGYPAHYPLKTVDDIFPPYTA
jgi:malate dehydrogenase (oxaloacetate-decarboxylating)(NADP+)